MFKVQPGGGTIVVMPLSGFGPGTYDLIDFPAGNANWLGNLTLSTTTLSGFTLSLQQTSTAEQLVVTAVPEPSTLALLAAGAVGLLAYGWRRRRAEKQGLGIGRAIHRLRRFHRFRRVNR